METNTHGEKKFSPDMTIGQAIALHPHAAQVLASFHLGGCSHCAISEHETIEEVCYGYGVPTEVLLEALNALFDQEAPSPSQES